MPWSHKEPPPEPSSSWFAVYRPCSRDAISKMLGRVGVGKGPNIKGKCARKNRLSGYVPFCQISINEDKEALGVTPRGTDSERWPAMFDPHGGFR